MKLFQDHRMTAKSDEDTDHIVSLEGERDRYLAALKIVLASAHPHPMENGQMYHAWEEARKVMKSTKTKTEP